MDVWSLQAHLLTNQHHFPEVPGMWADLWEGLQAGHPGAWTSQATEDLAVSSTYGVAHGGGGTSCGINSTSCATSALVGAGGRSTSHGPAYEAAGHPTIVTTNSDVCLGSQKIRAQTGTLRSRGAPTAQTRANHPPGTYEAGTATGAQMVSRLAPRQVGRAGVSHWVANPKNYIFFQPRRLFSEGCNYLAVGTVIKSSLYVMSFFHGIMRPTLADCGKNFIIT
ncbi:unnamed protein product [Protopolystoma xenopodis]|uniref:Uncharacterized protein n=1 Tax=Protopolystoma xenopodis TaxID=117903 RepID=A0A448XD90_9PLAT|nr:unnamed protein product [Protopolystoma xenopodis]